MILESPEGKCIKEDECPQPRLPTPPEEPEPPRIPKVVAPPDGWDREVDCYVEHKHPRTAPPLYILAGADFKGVDANYCNTCTCEEAGLTTCTEKACDVSKGPCGPE
jgi:hypothetical protein